MRELTEEEKGNQIFDRGWNDYLVEREYELRKNTMIDIHENLDGWKAYGWKSETPLTPFASDYQYYIVDKKIFSEEESKEWNDFLLEQEEIIKKKYSPGLRGTGRTGLGPEHVTSRYQYFNLLEFDFYLVPRLINEIMSGMKTVLSLSGNSDWHSTLFAKAWFNVMRQGEGMQLHSHSHHCRTLYGFHVSINAKETSTTYFHPEVLQVGPQGIDFLDSIDNPNQIGMITLFPNNIPHAVRSNQQKIPRISIAGDITPASNEENQIEQNTIEIGIL